MNYRQTLDYLFAQLPMFHRIGAAAYRADLTNTIASCNLLGNPENKFKSIHIAGTNGKGSTSHLIASVLQSAGYKTGLYTSPHLKDFRERIKINGQKIPKAWVSNFVSSHKKEFEPILELKISDIMALIIDSEQLNFEEAIQYLYESKLYAGLTNESTKLWHLSATKLFEMLHDEKQTNELIFPDYV